MSAKKPWGTRPPLAYRWWYRPRVRALEERALPGLLAPLSYDTGPNPRSTTGDISIWS